PALPNPPVVRVCDRAPKKPPKPMQHPVFTGDRGTAPMVRYLFFLTLSLTLLACTAKPDDHANAPLDDLAAAAPVAEPPTGSIAGTLPAAFATLPPEAGQPRSVAQKDFGDGILQEIAYDRALPGLNESRIELRIRTTPRLDGGQALEL